MHVILLSNTVSISNDSFIFLTFFLSEKYSTCICASVYVCAHAQISYVYEYCHYLHIYIHIYIHMYMKQFEMTKSKRQPYIQTLPCLNDTCLHTYLTTPSHEQDVTQGQFLKRRLEFSRVFLLLDWLPYQGQRI